MTEEDIDAAIGRLVSRYKAKLREQAAIRGDIGALVHSMQQVVGSALAGDRFNPYNIQRSDVPDDGWVTLPQLLDDLKECRAELTAIEDDLRCADLADLIQAR